MKFARLFNVAAVALLLASLGGVLPEWMPGTAALAGVVLLLAGVEWGARVIRANGWAKPIGVVQQHAFAIALTAVAAAGLVVRLFGIAHGPGHVPTDIDENRLALSVMHFFSTGTVEHETVEHYPGLHFWLLAGTFLLTYLWGLMTETIRSFAETPTDPFVIAGRCLNAGLEFGTIILTGLIGRSLAGPGAGVLAAALLGLAPLAIVISSQLRNEAALVLAVVAATYAALVATDSPIRRHVFLGGVFAGLAAAIKYSGVFALLPVLVAAAWSGTGRTRLLRASIALAGFAVALGTTNHFLWADFPNFVRQLSTEVGMTGAGHWAATANPRLYYPITLADQAFGWPLLIAAAGFTVYALSSGDRRGVILAAFPLTYWWFMSSRPSQFPRWAYTMTPFVAAAAAAGLWALRGAIGRVISGRSAGRSAQAGRFAALGVNVGNVIGAASLVPLLLISANEISRRPTAPPYALAEAWLAASSTAGDRVLSENAWLDFAGAPLEVQRVPNLPRSLNASDHELNTYQWIVVPEVYFGDPNVKRLVLAHAFDADRSLGGNAGIDIRIYQPPPLPPADASDLRLGAPASAGFLGLGWSDDRSEATGAGLGADGGRLFVPALVENGTRFEFEVMSAKPSSSAPVELQVDGAPVALEVLSSAGGRLRVLSAEIPRTSPRAKVLTLSLKPKPGAGDIRVLRCTIRGGPPTARQPAHG